MTELAAALRRNLGATRSTAGMADYGTSHPELVAQGIEQALITTAAGLAVAVPVHLVRVFDPREALAVLQLQASLLWSWAMERC